VASAARWNVSAAAAKYVGGGGAADAQLLLWLNLRPLTNLLTRSGVDRTSLVDYEQFKKFDSNILDRSILK